MYKEVGRCEGQGWWEGVGVVGVVGVGGQAKGGFSLPLSTEVVLSSQ